MTASAGAWYRAGTVNVTNGQQAVTGVGTNWQNDVISIAVGDIFTLDAKTWYEVTAVNSDTSITLDRDYEGGTENAANYAIVRNTSGTILTRIAGQISVQFNQKQLFLDELRTWLNSDNASEPLTDSHGVKQELKTPAQMVRDHDDKLAKLDSIHPFPWAMRKVEFEARRAANNEKYAASGFVHKGKHRNTGGLFQAVNEGLYTSTDTPNILNLGRALSEPNAAGASKVGYPEINIAGVLTDFSGYPQALYGVQPKFAPAEDGTRTYDSATGVSVTHATAAIAFASETETNKVVTDRVDMWGFEAFLREINDADPFVYKNGLIQSQASNIKGVNTVSDNIRPDTYFAWYEGDTTSRGKGVNWQTATEAQRIAIASDPENNIYFDDATGKFYQWCVRGRSFAGAGNGDWDSDGNSLKVTSASPLRFVNAFARVVVQGNKDAVSTFSAAGGDCYANNHTWGSLSGKFYTGIYSPRSSSNNSGVGINGECYFLVCGTVNRRNSGLYHHSFNKPGTAKASDDKEWYNTAQSFTSKADCFDSAKLLAGSGSIASAKSGAPDDRYYDAIYASGQGGVCRDMRYSAWGLKAEDFAEADLKIKSGEYRGTENLIRSKVYQCSSEGRGDGWGLYHQDALPGNNEIWINSDVYPVLDLFSVGDEVIIIHDSGEIVKTQVSSVYSNRAIVKYKTEVEFRIYSSGDQTGNYFIVSRKSQPSISGEYNHTEVIGAPADILLCDDLKDGWVGSWNSFIPDGIKVWADMPLNKPTKNTSLVRIYTNDSGVNWSNDNISIDPAFNSSTILGAPALGRVEVWNYKTQANVTKSSSNSPIHIGRNGIGELFASSDAGDVTGRGLGYSLIGGICKNNSSPPTVKRGVYKLISEDILLGSAMLLDSNNYGAELKHEPLTLTESNKNTPAFKTLNYNVVENQQGFINYAYTELHYDATAGDWGDDSKVHIADNQTTMLDENGHIVLVGTARCVEPLGWIKNDK